MSKRLVCLDSNVVIWGVKKQAIKEQELMIERTERYLEHLDSEGFEILIPSVVLAEILPIESKEKQIAIMKIIQSKFRIGEFNANTAMIFSDLFGDDIKANKDFAKDNHINYNKLKIDYMIAATAIENYCSMIVTNNTKDFKTYSRDRIKIIEVQEVSIQTNLQI